MRFLLMLALVLPLAAQNFSHDIAPIIYRNWRVLSPAWRIRTLLAAQLRRCSQTCPPDRRGNKEPLHAATWLPQPGYGDFQDEHRLTDAQIKLIGDWVGANMPEGNPSQTPPPPKFTEGWQLGPPDLVIKAPQPFSLAATGPDAFWNFVFTPAIPDPPASVPAPSKFAPAINASCIMRT